MNTILMVLAFIAIVCFVLAAIGRDDGRGVPIGLVFLTMLILLSGSLP